MNMAKILVVDDNKLAVKMIADLLVSKGYGVSVAFSGEEALAQVRDEVRDLVVSDLMMPEMDGYELCRRLRRDPVTAKVPIILLTSMGRISNKEAGFEAGADDYLVKPVVPAELELKSPAGQGKSRSGCLGGQGDQRFQLAWWGGCYLTGSQSGCVPGPNVAGRGAPD
jgi:CheY-like chemotaxis protein